MTARTALSLVEVSVRLGGRLVLDGLSLTALQGESLAVLGPNGAGKTTLVRCCTGLREAPDSGAIDVLGRSAGAPGANDQVGLMPQSTGAWSGVRPQELLSYLGSLYVDPVPVDALLDELGIRQFATTPYRRLSGGQQLVNLAGSIIGRPRLVFLDEPTAGLDPHARRSVWELITRLREAGVAVVLTTHAMDEAEHLADQVVLLDAGRVVAAGTVAELTTGHSLEELFLALTQPQGRRAG